MTYGCIVRDGTNTPRTITGIQVRDATNTPRDISEAWVRDSNNVPRMFFSLTPPLSASASPSSVLGTTVGTGSATTSATTVTPVGGTPPFTYAWTLISHSSFVEPTATAPTSATTAFTQTAMAPTQEYDAQWRCLVTDSLGATATAICNAFWIDQS